MSEAPPGKAVLRLFLVEGTLLEDRDGGALRIIAPPNRYRPPLDLPPLGAGARGALGRLAQPGGASMEELLPGLLSTEGARGVATLRQLLAILSRYAVLGRTLVVQGDPLVSLEPLSNLLVFRERAAEPGTRCRVSRFAWLRRAEEGWVLESPLGHGRLRFHDGRALTALQALSAPQSGSTLAGLLDGWGEEGCDQFLNLLANAGALARVNDEGHSEEEMDSTLAPWEFADLCLHSRSRQGRAGGAYGGTYPFQGRWEPLPVVKRPMSDEVVELPRPDLEERIKTDPPFGRVLEDRRSVREQGGAPIRLEELAEFLFRSARIQHVSEEAGVSFRPHPAGGALHELEIYPLVHRCEGLDPGLYHYDAGRHELQRVPGPEAPLQVLLGMAGAAAEMQETPQVVLIVAARFGRIQRKYRAVSYAVTLKNVGALFQTFYLVATAMGLAPTAVGGGNSDLFAAASGLDYLEEGSVGEFILGSRSE